MTGVLLFCIVCVLYAINENIKTLNKQNHNKNKRF